MPNTRTAAGNVASNLLLAAVTAGFECGTRSIAHALGTPLNVVLGTAELAASGSSAGADFERVQQNARAMTERIARILGYAPPPDSRASRGSPEELRRTLDELVPAMHVELEGAAETLPADSAALLVLVLGRIGEPAGACVARITRDGRDVVIGVRLPAGSPLSTLSRRGLAEPWYADIAPPPAEGLWAAIASQICRWHGGQLRVSGDEITARLPCA